MNCASMQRHYVIMQRVLMRQFFIRESMDGSEASEALFLSEEDPPNEMELGEEYGENNRGRCVLQKVVA